MENVDTKYLMNDCYLGVCFEIEEGKVLVASRSEAAKISYVKYATQTQWVKNQKGDIWLSYEIDWNAYLEATNIKPIEELYDGSKLYRVHTHCTANDLSDRYNNFIYILNGKHIGTTGKSMWVSDQHDVTRYESSLIAKLNKQLASVPC
jgi:hypothetical protein